MNERDRNTWEVVGFWTRTAISTFGEFHFKRRLYRNKKTGETKFFLDELLGWPARVRITPRLKELAVKLSTELSFNRAAEILSYLFPGKSHDSLEAHAGNRGNPAARRGRKKGSGF